MFQESSLCNSRREARDIIDGLSKNNFYAECPHCNETIALKYAHLFYLNDFPPEAKELYQSRLEELKERRARLREIPREIAKISENSTKAVNFGLTLERIAPLMDNFPFNYNDCRSLFEPIDYIVFEGLSRKGIVERIVFAEIKTGESRLNKRQWQIRFLVERKRVHWSTYEIGGVK
jgi:predicted Holliday junction resolvase-like endonuclease